LPIDGVIALGFVLFLQKTRNRKKREKRNSNLPCIVLYYLFYLIQVLREAAPLEEILNQTTEHTLHKIY
jgi:hypothetical protein